MGLASPGLELCCELIPASLCGDRVSQVQVSDGGIYTCVASSPAGVAEQSFILQIQGMKGPDPATGESRAGKGPRWSKTTREWFVNQKEGGGGLGKWRREGLHGRKGRRWKRVVGREEQVGCRSEDREGGVLAEGGEMLHVGDPPSPEQRRSLPA